LPLGFGNIVFSQNSFSFTKTIGFTGAAGTGTPANGTPNLTIQFTTTGELNFDLGPGTPGVGKWTAFLV
jgi:hypothetical protein